MRLEERYKADGAKTDYEFFHKPALHRLNRHHDNPLRFETQIDELAVIIGNAPEKGDYRLNDQQRIKWYIDESTGETVIQLDMMTE
jgi:hypothetical protein